ncbi:MAG: ABC transporter ATP-binding protein [Chitinophagaceae bacterium]|nr:ABC transporter ATP-binding protein [Chitinophagaceae bacterium]
MNLTTLNSPAGFPLLWNGVGVRLFNVGKRFNREWIFRRFNHEFVTGKNYAITGPNGSGKSTLLQVIAGATLHNEGTVEYHTGQTKTTDEKQYSYISIAAPYLELIEEMTAKEMLDFHSKFKPLIQSLTIEEMLTVVGLETAINKQIRYFSSGMKQRLKLAQAFFSNTPILLLDEPTTNLDADGIALYQNLINHYTKNKLVIVSSNVKQEYDFCEEVIEIGDYK